MSKTKDRRIIEFLAPDLSHCDDVVSVRGEVEMVDGAEEAAAVNATVAPETPAIGSMGAQGHRRIHHCQDIRGAICEVVECVILRQRVFFVFELGRKDCQEIFVTEKGQSVLCNLA